MVGSAALYLKVKRVLEKSNLAKCPKCRGVLTLDFYHELGFSMICVYCGHEEYLGRAPKNR